MTEGKEKSTKEGEKIRQGGAKKVGQRTIGKYHIEVKSTTETKKYDTSKTKCTQKKGQTKMDRRDQKK